MVTTESLLFGTSRDRSVSLVTRFFAFIALALFGAMALDQALPAHPVTHVVAAEVVPLLLLYAPAPVAFIGAYTRCGAPACLTVGIVPGVVFGLVVLVATVVGVPVVSSGTGPLWGLGLSIGFSLVGLSSAFVGYCAGVTAVLAVDTLGEDPPDGEGVDDSDSEQR